MEYGHENPKAARDCRQRLDERRYVLTIDGVVRYVGTKEECQRRLSMLVANNDRAEQDAALGRLWRIMR